MPEKDTNELDRALGRTHLTDYPAFMASNVENMISEATSFSAYIKNILKSNGLTQQAAFLRADIPERYGYKLLSGEKHTRQRDVILRLCYAAELTLDQTQRARQCIPEEKQLQTASDQRFTGVSLRLRARGLPAQAFGLGHAFCRCGILPV